VVSLGDVVVDGWLVVVSGLADDGLGLSTGGAAGVVEDSPGIAGLAGMAEVDPVVAAVLVEAPVEAIAEPDHQSREARTLGGAFRYSSSMA
jgi:hypothetical protein